MSQKDVTAALTPILRLRQLLGNLNVSTLSHEERLEIAEVTTSILANNPRQDVQGSLAAVNSTQTIEATDLIIQSIRSLRSIIHSVKRDKKLDAALLLRIMKAFDTDTSEYADITSDAVAMDLEDDPNVGDAANNNNDYINGEENNSTDDDVDSPPPSIESKEENLFDVLKFNSILKLALQPGYWRIESLKLASTHLNDTIVPIFIDHNDVVTKEVIRKWMVSFQFCIKNYLLCCCFSLFASVVF